MPDLIPFADESTSLQIGELTVENRLDRLSLYGSLDLTADQIGLDQARQLKVLIDAVVNDLSARHDLPIALEPAPIDEVANPWR
ncbi:hypothetical protein KSF73_07450 [Burkholderiaceae bacterium DAT-1]|nr:hypothetical protein [Burkholderiaceae bacterium DAT-1]